MQRASHLLEQRCCRWLLMTHDRMETDEFLLTHEFPAMRRAGVTEAASGRQRAGLIRYKRGLITILDKEELKRRSGEYGRELGARRRPARPVINHHGLAHRSHGGAKGGTGQSGNPIFSPYVKCAE